MRHNGPSLRPAPEASAAPNHLATVPKADRIAKMDEGRIPEGGAHRELVAKSGLHARLAALQLGEAA